MQPEDIETPAMRPLLGGDNTARLLGGDNTARLADVSASHKESAFALFNPAEEAGLMRMWNNTGPFISRSPLSQIDGTRFIGHPEDRDESPFDGRILTPLSTLMARSYFSGAELGGDKDPEKQA